MATTPSVVAILPVASGHMATGNSGERFEYYTSYIV